MQKIILAVCASTLLSFSLNSHATDVATDANIALKSTLHQVSPSSSTNNAFMYGGQDISRPVIASADESLMKFADSSVG